MREHERARRDPERTDDERRPVVPGPAADLLALQRSAGNQAVRAMLSREPKPTAPPKKETGFRVVFPGIGTIPVESIQMGATQARPGRPAEREPGPPAFSDMHFTSRVGGHSTA